ncbi:MAG: serine/threonine protein kinase [Rhodobacteraceae bacterium]|nr:serine/threonine protein kinase [Paracoccaceae bacterium]
MLPDTEESAQVCDLPLGSILLKGQYEIQGQLAVGGFGITYLARDSLERQVVVKECFPHDICLRDGFVVRSQSDQTQDTYLKVVANFIAEARRLAKLKHPNIVSVHQVFEENQTAYMAMDFFDGVELLDILEFTPQRLTPKLLRKTLRDALDALHYLHGEGMLHRDVSPDNLLLDAQDHLVLIDFGAAVEHSQKASGNYSFMLAVKDGYSPYEFYAKNAPQNPSSDLYSLAATFFHLITGSAPTDCWTRYKAISSGLPDPYTPLTDGEWEYEADFLALLDRALSVEKIERIQSAEQWIRLLDEEAQEIAEPSAKPIVQKQVRENPGPILASDEIDKVISRLVKDTNSGIESNPKTESQTKNKSKSEPAASKTEKRPTLFVDIMGDPVEDVELWLREQEKKFLTEEKPAKCNTSPTNEPDVKPEPAPKSLIMRLLFRNSILRRGETPVA